jgi:hypothetical protein
MKNDQQVFNDVTEELRELNEKRDRLGKFIHGHSAAAKHLRRHQYALLQVQEIAMATYAEILDQRLIDIARMHGLEN